MTGAAAGVATQRCNGKIKRKVFFYAVGGGCPVQIVVGRCFVLSGPSKSQRVRADIHFARSDQYHELL